MSQQDPNNENKYYTINHTSAVLSMNTALLGEVSPALRAAKIKWDDETVRLYFYYDGTISEEDHESAECVATEVISDFPEHKLEVDIFQWDYPQPIPQEGLHPVYHRRESKPTFISRLLHKLKF